jgi:hypothetical protein
MSSARGIFYSFVNATEVTRGKTEIIMKMDRIPRPIVIVGNTRTVMVTTISYLAARSTEVYSGMPDISPVRVCPNIAVERRRSVRANYEGGTYLMAVSRNVLTPSEHLEIWVILRRACVMISFVCQRYAHQQNRQNEQKFLLHLHLL